jgi:hypothetical protein
MEPEFTRELLTPGVGELVVEDCVAVVFTRWMTPFFLVS